MRKFSSYGSVDIELHYYAPRKRLSEHAYTQLVGETPYKGGHYITAWGPRQTGKTWIMQQALFRLQKDERFDTVKINLQIKTDQQGVGDVIKYISEALSDALNKPDIEGTGTPKEFESLFSRKVLDKPLILILDEFDCLSEKVIADLVKIFRNIYISRQDQSGMASAEKNYLLHSLALIGVRAVLGIENVTGSPFNVQRSLHIPNLNFDEVSGMFKWYERESGQKIEADVVARLFHETQGQPGLTCWFGELLTETYNQETDQAITMDDFDEVYADAIDVLPNHNILNIISKAKQAPYKSFVLDMFRTDEKIKFKYDNQNINFLYMNGVVSREKISGKGNYVKFACPFAQKRLFNYFADEIFPYMGKLYEPFESLDDIITEDSLNLENLLRRYGQYLEADRDRILKDAPRRTDLRIFEAVYHFNLYHYLMKFLENYGGKVYPEFPTGNGQIDLIIEYEGKRYGVEVKSYTNQREYKRALKQAARYADSLGLTEITLAFFIEAVDDDNRKKYEMIYTDEKRGVTVRPVFVEIGSRE